METESMSMKTNKEGMTFTEWMRATRAFCTPTKKHREAWKAGVDPTEFHPSVQKQVTVAEFRDSYVTSVLRDFYHQPGLSAPVVDVPQDDYIRAIGGVK